MLKSCSDVCPPDGKLSEGGDDSDVLRTWHTAGAQHMPQEFISIWQIGVWHERLHISVKLLTMKIEGDP